MMNFMLVCPNSPNNRWGEAISACLLENLIPHKKSDKTPFKLRLPSYSRVSESLEVSC